MANAIERLIKEVEAQKPQRINGALMDAAAAELASLREELDALRLVADAARTGQGLDDALDAGNCCPPLAINPPQNEKFTLNFTIG
jgi:hypothetical protein